MKKIALVAAFALAACSQAEETEVTEETAAVEPVAVTAADGGMPYGAYEVSTADGTTVNYVVNEDGTYSVTGPDGESVSGTWTQDTSDVFCSTEEGATEATCYNEVIDENGVWTSTNVNDPEDTSTVVRIN